MKISTFNFLSLIYIYDMYENIDKKKIIDNKS